MLVIRAVHIRADANIPGDALKDATLRYAGKRGPCTLKLSNIGTNFVDADGGLAEAYELWQSEELLFAISI